ncbi:metal ABC transporter ATP-binding protein [Methanohalophilus mahii]|uniref:Cobalamin import ATP-binding protein BtuD n=1 Tax=Methanohalophilus mahii (strain ATCC 35705 / DSM 5219 / SLP) TaxID=547558 RepID=D5E6V2_METMS|nr:metal ABC transporter ATP-binding protein [Methanohalophilus mahii]ADE36890.1 ABC transporter related protein [Methanohalophilus mahii DSM 5219]
MKDSNNHQNAVEIKDVWSYYHDVPALKEINLDVQEGTFLGIIGPNGGGKSTLLKVILGLIEPDRGDVRVFGKKPKEGRKTIGYVPQHSASKLDFPINVWDVVMMGRIGKTSLFSKYNPNDRKVVKESLEKVKMYEYRDRHIAELSGGQRQRVFIARALASEPKLLLLDEPVAGIDTTMQKEFYEMLEELKSRVTIIMVTHDISAVSIYVDKVACLNQKLYYHGTKELKPEDLEEAYKCPVEMIAHGVPHRVLKAH